MSDKDDSRVRGCIPKKMSKMQDDDDSENMYDNRERSRLALLE